MSNGPADLDLNEWRQERLAKRNQARQSRPAPENPEIKVNQEVVDRSLARLERAQERVAFLQQPWVASVVDGLDSVPFNLEKEGWVELVDRAELNGLAAADAKALQEDVVVFDKVSAPVRKVFLNIELARALTSVEVEDSTARAVAKAWALSDDTISNLRVAAYDIVAFRALPEKRREMIRELALRDASSLPSSHQEVLEKRSRELLSELKVAQEISLKIRNGEASDLGQAHAEQLDELIGQGRALLENTTKPVYSDDPEKVGSARREREALTKMESELNYFRYQKQELERAQAGASGASAELQGAMEKLDGKIQALEEKLGVNKPSGAQAETKVQPPPLDSLMETVGMRRKKDEEAPAVSSPKRSP